MAVEVAALHSEVDALMRQARGLSDIVTQLQYVERNHKSSG